MASFGLSTMGSCCVQDNGEWISIRELESVSVFFFWLVLHLSLKLAASYPTRQNHLFLDTRFARSHQLTRSEQPSPVAVRTCSLTVSSPWRTSIWRACGQWLDRAGWWELRSLLDINVGISSSWFFAQYEMRIITIVVKIMMTICLSLSTFGRHWEMRPLTAGCDKRCKHHFVVPDISNRISDDVTWKKT